MDQGWYHYHFERRSSPANGLFIHDFVPVELPFDAVVGAFTYFVSPELISMLVTRAWASELLEAGNVLESGPPNDEEPIVVAQLGAVRVRRGAVVVPFSWRAEFDGWVPSLQADLEIAGFGPERTHLHVMGLSQLAPGSQPCTERASLDHRLAVALVRSVLVSLAGVLTSASVESTT